MNLSPTHVHLLLNHIPTVGFIIAIALFLSSRITKSPDLERAALVIFVVVALITIPTYVTGDAARKTLENSPGVSSQLMFMHESAALVSLMLMVVVGGCAWLGLWQYRRMGRLPAWNAAVVLVLSIATLASVTRAANLGGEIRHPEIRVTQDQADARLPLGRTVGDFVRDTAWFWPTLETLHFIGLSLLIGVMLLVNLRMLGFARQLSLDAVDRLLPWGVLGFGINVITGMLFVTGADYTKNVAFYWKLAFVLVAGADMLYFFFDRGWVVGPGVEVPVTSKMAAASALFLWVGVMFWGSMLPFIGDAF